MIIYLKFAPEFVNFAAGRSLLRHKMEAARWAANCEEERERFRAGMRGRRGCGLGRGDVQTGTAATR